MPDASTLLPFSSSHAFIIGNDAYQEVSKLQSAVKDATDIARLLKDVHGYEIHALYDATQAQMLELLGDPDQPEAGQDPQKMIRSIVKEGDRLIFYFAGHGIAVDSKTDPEGYLVPIDAERRGKQKLVPMDLLHKTLLDLPCRHGLLILDCCFAGSFKWSTGFRSLFMDDSEEEMYEERFLRFVDNPAWQVITSSASDQKALDLISHDSLGLRDSQSDEPILEVKNSPFAYALQQAINLEGKADVVRGKRSDGVITASELYLYIREIVEEASRKQGSKQSPALFTLRTHNTKGEFVFIHPGHPLNLKKAPDRNPYRGLSAYSEKEEDINRFFGRTHAIAVMAHKLKSTAILVVSAPSGHGKSSTVKAGLFPFLQRELGYEREQFLVLRPGDKASEAWEQLAQIKASEQRIILIDQYEEMYTEAVEMQARFEAALLELMKRMQAYKQEHTAKTSPLKLVLTIRSDFEWKLKSSDIGQSFWQEERLRSFLYRLPPMTLEELREATVKPARVIAYEFESEELVDRILEEINHAPGALPLLSFALHKLYELRDRDKRLFTQSAYLKQLGGINGALSKHGDSVYQSLPSKAHQAFMRKLMLRMVRLNDGSYSRRRVYLRYDSLIWTEKVLSELDYPDHLDQMVEEVLEILEREENQLIVRGKDELGPYVEPMHDSLINHWPMCLQWIQDFGRENLVLQRQLWQAVVEHHQWEADVYSQPNASAPLWDNNPKLQQLQLSITDPQDAWLCKKGWGEKSISSVAWLLWQEAELSTSQKEDLQDYAWFFGEEPYEQGRYQKAIDSEQIFEKIKGQMDAWLNEAELDFVKGSFERQRSELERVKQQRDEAIRAKEEAEAARQRAADEMIEASWKTGTLIQPSADVVQGARDLYNQLRLLMDVKKARSLSPVPIFVAGPHGDDFDLASDNFGHYNPAFLDWAKKYVIPASRNTLLRNLTQPFFNRFMRDMSRVYHMAYRYLSRHEALRDRVIKEYLQYIDNLQNGLPLNKGISEDPGEIHQWYKGDLPNYQYDSGGLFLEARFGNFAQTYYEQFTDGQGFVGYYLWVSACGFWVRRKIDTTDIAFFEILEQLLETYDAEWLAHPPQIVE